MFPIPHSLHAPCGKAALLGQQGVVSANRQISSCESALTTTPKVDIRARLHLHQEAAGAGLQAVGAAQACEQAVYDLHTHHQVIMHGDMSLAMPDACAASRDTHARQD